MKRKAKILSLVPVLLSGALLLSLSCRTKLNSRNRFDENQFPHTILWAWERPEDLEFLDSQKFAIAFLAQTLVLKGSEVTFNPRRQPLNVPREIKMIAVTRIESQKTTGTPTALSLTQREELVKLILRTLELRNVSAIQIDFDALVSEREFYRSLLQELRRKLPDSVPLSMTALASFCIGDPWVHDLPVDEAVPMIFRMGSDDRTIKNFLAKGNDFRDPVCRRSYGISVDEPVQIRPDNPRRMYVFNVRAWTRNDVVPFQLESR